jgi:hypothetical protein
MGISALCVNHDIGHQVNPSMFNPPIGRHYAVPAVKSKGKPDSSAAHTNIDPAPGISQEFAMVLIGHEPKDDE